MNQNTACSKIQDERYYQGGGMFFDRALTSFSMDEELTEHEYRSEFNDFTISDIFGEDIFSEDNEENQEKVSQRYQIMKSEFSSGRKTWYKAACQILSNTYERIFSKSEIDLRSDIQGVLSYNHVSNLSILQALYSELEREKRNHRELYSNMLVKDSESNVIWESEVNFLDELCNTLDQLLIFFQIGSIHNFPDFQKTLKLIQNIMLYVNSGSCDYQGIFERVEKLHSWFLMRNFFIDPKEIGITDSTIIKSPSSMRCSNPRAVFNVSNAIKGEIDIILDGSERFYLPSGIQSENNTHIRIRGLQSSVKANIRIEGDNSSYNFHFSDLKDSKIVLHNASQVRYSRVSGDIQTWRSKTVETEDTQGILTHRGVPHVIIKNHSGDIRNSGVENLTIDGATQNWWKKRKYVI